MIQNLLIGDNPFIGVDHFSQDRARDTLARLNSHLIAEVIVTALHCGAKGFVFSTHPTNLEVLRLLKMEYPDLTLEMHPLIPYAQGYIRLMNEKGTVALFTDFMSKLSTSGKFKALVGGGFSAMTMNPFKLLAAFVDAEVEGFVRASNEKNQLRTIFLHEIIVDLAVALKMSELLVGYINHIRDSYDAKPGLVSRNFPRLVEFLEEIGERTQDIRIMTPFNALGFQMNPSRLECESVLDAKPGLDLIAMSVLAAGMLDLNGAVEYIKSRPNLKSIVVGVSRIDHARDTTKAFLV